MLRLRRQPMLTIAPATFADDATSVSLAKRDRQAFEPLYRAYLGRIYAYCYRRLGDEQAAEDATQQIFVQAMIQLPSCRDESFRGWLFTIAHNVTANIVRGWRSSDPLEAAAGLPDGTASFEDRAVDVALIDQLTQALDRLTPDQREVILLRFSGVSVHETAGILHSTAGAIKQLQHRALLRLRSQMGLDPEGKETHHD